MKAPHHSVHAPSETLGEHYCRVRRGEFRPPLRTLRELAEELGVQPMSLSNKMHADPRGPRPRYTTGGHHTPKNTWYDPGTVRAWWAAKSAAKDFA